MCGIFGFSFAKQPSATQKDRLSIALGILNDQRGGHSWGFWTPKLGVQKGLGNIGKHIGKAAQHSLLMAHTRFATHGNKTPANAHPFVVKNIIGAHNGVIFNHTDLNKKYDRKFEVDSLHIFQHMADGLSPDELTGYGTAEWVDTQRPNEIRLCKMTGSGDLEIVRVPGGIVWSSDDDHLGIALAAAGLKVKSTFKLETGEVLVARDGGLFTTGDSFKISPSTYTDSRTSGYGGGFYSSMYGGGWELDDEKSDEYTKVYPRGSLSAGNESIGNTAEDVDDGRLGKADEKELKFWEQEEAVYEKWRSGEWSEAEFDRAQRYLYEGYSLADTLAIIESTKSKNHPLDAYDAMFERDRQKLS